MSTRSRTRRTALFGGGLLLGVLSVAPIGAAAPAASAATPPTGGYASTYFAINYDTATPTVDPPADEQNSTGAHNSATLVGWSAGSVDFVVTFPGVGGPGGIAFATGDGAGEGIPCTVNSWWHDGTTEKVAVHCSVPISDAYYQVAYTRQVAAAGSYAYAQASRPTAASYTPDATYQYSTSGMKMTVTRQGVGRYTVTVPSVVTAGGTVAVGASGSANAYCRVVAWKPTGSGAVSTQKVLVNCDRPWGGPVDSPFVIAYAQGTSILGAKDLAGYWLNANRPYAKDYIAPHRGIGNQAAHIWNDPPGTVYTGTGYWVTCSSTPAKDAATPFLLQTAGSFAYVTAEGPSHNVCNFWSG
jgi:hypothetical protein